MNETTEREDTADESGVELTRLLAMPWYLLEQPWARPEKAGTMILAGSDDPHIGIPLCDTEDWDGEHYEQDVARGLAQHIVDLHNASLEAG